MPQKYAIKEFAPESFYHVYARGSSKQPVFVEAADYRYFIGLFERYLSREPRVSKMGVTYPHHRGRVLLLSYCLMRNHFHLLIYQQDHDALEKFMRSVMTSYSRYFNLKYKRSGAVFESRYKAKLISDDAYLQHISRYIHLNPRGWQTYRYSSYRYYVGEPMPEWLDTQKIMELFGDAPGYEQFLADYEDVHATLEDLKHELADS